MELKLWHSAVGIIFTTLPVVALLLGGSVIEMINELDRSRDVMTFQMKVINDVYGADTTILLLLCR